MIVHLVVVLGSQNRYHDPEISTNVYLQLLVTIRAVELPAVDHPL